LFVTLQILTNINSGIVNRVVTKPKSESVRSNLPICFLTLSPLPISLLVQEKMLILLFAVGRATRRSLKAVSKQIIRIYVLLLPN